MIYNPTVNNCVKHNKYQPHFSAKLSLVSLSLFSALSAPAWADNVTLTQEEYNTLINRITQLEQKWAKILTVVQLWEKTLKRLYLVLL